MSEFNLVVRNGLVLTASDFYDSEISGDGAEIALGAAFDRRGREINATPKQLRPGGIDAHSDQHRRTGIAASPIPTAKGS